MQEALQKAGIEALFPVQVAVWNQVLGPGGRERDLCVCSPTGSGKTLSFALPIVQLLSTRVLRRLRALVVLPTRDLAVQVLIVSCTDVGLLSVGNVLGMKHRKGSLLAGSKYVSYGNISLNSRFLRWTVRERRGG